MRPENRHLGSVVGEGTENVHLSLQLAKIRRLR